MKCPICNTEMKEEMKEIDTGVYSKVEVCSKCGDEWYDKKGYEKLYKLFKRKAFNIGGSIAVRIPKEIANSVGIKDGTEVNFSVSKDKVIISLI